MVRGVFIERTPSEKMLVSMALERYVSEVVPTKKESTQRRKGARIREVSAFFGKYSLAAVTPDLVAKFRDMRFTQGKLCDHFRTAKRLWAKACRQQSCSWQSGMLRP